MPAARRAGSRWLAVALAAGALALTAWRAIVPAGSTCQTTAWDTTPKTEDLPSGWTISATQYDVDRKQMTVVGRGARGRVVRRRRSSTPR